MPTDGRPIFHDPAGKRWSWVKRISAFLIFYSSIVGVLLCFTILLLPASHFAGADQEGFRALSFKRESREDAAEHYLGWRTLQRMQQQSKREEAAHARLRRIDRSNANHTVVGFYVNWDPNSFNSFRQHIDDLSYVMPEWLSLASNDQLYTNNYSPTSRDQDVIKLAAGHQLPLVPILNNSNNDDFQWAPLKQLLSDPARQQALANRVRDYLVANHFAGINIDFEVPYDKLTDAQMPEMQRLMHTELPHFMNTLQHTLAPHRLLVTEDVPADDGKNFDYAALAEPNDFLIVMQYDQHSPTDSPGPIAGQDWLEHTANNLFDKVDSSKIVLGIGNYCYDWPVTLDKDGNVVKAHKGRELQLGTALNIASNAGATIQMDDPDLNPYFYYTDDDNQDHMVYMLDAVTAYNHVSALKDYGPRGVALWYLGSEDPTIWSFMSDDHLAVPVPTSALANVDFRGTLDIDISPSGDELTQTMAVSKAGVRTFTTDADGLITSEQYQHYPTPYVIQQFGPTGKTIALTFDDGPDPRYTPRILQVLKDNHVPGTFFIIGKYAAQYPSIIRQSWANGNELGNHTYTHPHIETISPWRAQMELNATQRIIESLTGHMTLLFRPPYGDGPDTGTITAQDLPLLAQLERNNYTMVGMNIDPKDYLKPPPEMIVQRIDEQLANNHVILLHDGGGDRTTTIEALPLIIRDLRAKGYRFVTISQLMGPEWHDKLFPAVNRNQWEIAGFDRFIFYAWYGFTGLLSVLFLLAIGLGVVRLLAFSALALRHHRQARRRHDDGEYLPPVTVAIPAYNEGKVVCRTVASVLDSAYPDLHVIAVDDGSTDDTADTLEEHYAGDQRVTIVRKENGGKATALNAAFALAKTEIVVCMDADTIFTPETIGKLVRQFRDPQVGAVAGNVKVGNRVNVLTLWQSLEYITSQNFDREAFAALNSVSVIPGAVGAWRREAVMAAGGFETNTLAEDTDLTFKIRLQGYHTRCDNDALGYTEVPDSVPTLAKQRFRWAFGILQALWKHRQQMFKTRHGAFSMVVMPSMWLFNIFLQALAPIVDLTIVLSIFSGQLIAVLYYTAAFYVLDFTAAFIAIRLDPEYPEQIIGLFWQRFFNRQSLQTLASNVDPSIILAIFNGQLIAVLYYTAAFYVLDFTAAFYAVRPDREYPKHIVWLFWQRFFYRQFMYYIIVRALIAAARGGLVGWSKLQRKDTVSLPPG